MLVRNLFSSNATALKDMGSSKDVVAADVVRLGVASLVLDKKDVRKTEKYAEAFKVFSVMKARAFVKQADGAPILMFRTSDGTPLMTKERYRHSSVSGRRRVLRIGGCAEEYLAQRAFLLREGVDGPLVRCVLADPLPLTQGHSYWHIHAAER